MVRRRAHKTGKTDKGHGGQRGLSEVLMEFVGEIVPEDATDQEFEQSVELAVVLWNLALLPQEQQGEMLWRMRERADRGDDPFFAGRLHELIDVRMQRYGQDRRLVMDFRIEDSKRGRTLWVTSVDADGASPAKG